MQEVNLNEHENVVGVIAAIIALGGFAVAIVAGLSSGNSAGAVLSRAILALVVCYACGLVIGAAGRAALRMHVDAHAKNNPLPARGRGAAQVVDDEQILDV